MRDNSEGGELDYADDVSRRCKKHSLSVRDGRGSDVGTGYSGREGKGPVCQPRDEKREGLTRDSCEKDFASRQYNGLCLIFAMTGLRIWAKGSAVPVLTSESAISLSESRA